MQLVTAGSLTHDGDPETARQMSRVTARAVPKGWALASASGESVVAHCPLITLSGASPSNAR